MDSITLNYNIKIIQKKIDLFYSNYSWPCKLLLYTKHLARLCKSERLLITQATWVAWYFCWCARKMLGGSCRRNREPFRVSFVPWWNNILGAVYLVGFKTLCQETEKSESALVSFMNIQVLRLPLYSRVARHGYGERPPVPIQREILLGWWTASLSLFMMCTIQPSTNSRSTARANALTSSGFEQNEISSPTQFSPSCRI